MYMRRIQFSQVLDICLRLRVRCVTVYAFAIDNFNRPKDEVDALMTLAEHRLVELAEKGWVWSLVTRCVLMYPYVVWAADKS